MSVLKAILIICIALVSLFIFSIIGMYIIIASVMKHEIDDEPIEYYPAWPILINDNNP